MKTLEIFQTFSTHMARIVDVIFLISISETTQKCLASFTLADTLSVFLRVRVLYQLLMEKCVSTMIKVYQLNKWGLGGRQPPNIGNYKAILILSFRCRSMPCLGHI